MSGAPGRGLRGRIARRLRFWLDRFDPHGAPRLLTTFTFTHEETEPYFRLRSDGRGCQLAYLGQDEYKKAHTESDAAAARAQRRADLREIAGQLPPLARDAVQAVLEQADNNGGPTDG